MTDIVVKQTQDACGNTICPAQTYNITNFKNASLNIRSPVSKFAIPQQPSDECSPKATSCQGTITIKTEGNVQNIQVGWTLVNSSTDLSLLCCVSTACATRFPCGVKTVADQIKYLTEDFENVSINEKFTIKLSCVPEKSVLSENFNISINDQTPITWQATWDFAVGKIITSTCEG